MKIGHKFDFVIGNFKTKTGELIAVCKTKYNEVSICIKNNMHIPVTRVKLHSKDRFEEAEAVLEDAYTLANETARRFNEFPENDKR